MSEVKNSTHLSPPLVHPSTEAKQKATDCDQKVSGLAAKNIAEPKNQTVKDEASQEGFSQQKPFSWGQSIKKIYCHSIEILSGKNSTDQNEHGLTKKEEYTRYKYCPVIGVSAAGLSSVLYSDRSDGVSSFLMFIGVTSIALACEYFKTENPSIVNYTSNIDLTSPKEEAICVPLAEAVKAYGWEKVFKHATLDPKSFEKEFLEIEENCSSFLERIELHKSATEGLKEIDSNAFSIPPLSDRMDQFLEEIKDLTAIAIIKKYPIDDLKRFGIMPKKTFWIEKWSKDVSKIDMSSVPALYSSGNIESLEIHTDQSLKIFESVKILLDVLEAKKNAYEAVLKTPLTDDEKRKGITTERKNKQAESAYDAAICNLSSQFTILKKNYLSALTSNFPKSA